VKIGHALERPESGFPCPVGPAAKALGGGFHWAAGSDGETNFGITSVAAPQAVSSRVARYSFTARLAPFRIAIFAPVLTRDRALLVGIGLDQARIDCKAFTANKANQARFSR
jgi:hypothetical protein